MLVAAAAAAAAFNRLAAGGLLLLLLKSRIGLGKSRRVGATHPKASRTPAGEEQLRETRAAGCAAAGSWRRRRRWTRRRRGCCRAPTATRTSCSSACGRVRACVLASLGCLRPGELYRSRRGGPCSLPQSAASHLPPPSPHCRPAQLLQLHVPPACTAALPACLQSWTQCMHASWGRGTAARTRPWKSGGPVGGRVGVGVWCVCVCVWGGGGAAAGRLETWSDVPACACTCGMGGSCPALPLAAHSNAFAAPPSPLSRPGMCVFMYVCVQLPLGGPL